MEFNKYQSLHDYTIIIYIKLSNRFLFFKEASFKIYIHGRASIANFYSTMVFTRNIRLAPRVRIEIRRILSRSSKFVKCYWGIL